MKLKNNMPKKKQTSFFVFLLLSEAKLYRNKNEKNTDSARHNF